jgi:RNA polymerase sigma-70 factor (ECF subfamily)
MTQDLETLSDEALMEAYQQGDDIAFAVLYRRHSPKIYGYLVNSLRDGPFVDDVFQAVFLKLHRTRAHYDPAFPFLPWLFTVCKSVMIDAIRKKKSILEETNEDALDQAEAQDQRSEVSLPDLGRLPGTQRKAVELRYGQDLSFEEISKRLETSPANVRQLISRALKRLRVIR